MTEQTRDISYNYAHFILELIIAGMLLFLGIYFENNLIVALSFSLLIVSFLIMIAFTSRELKEVNKIE